MLKKTRNICCFHDANCQYNEQHTLEKLKEFILSRAYKVEPIELIGFFLSQAGIEFLIENYNASKIYFNHAVFREGINFSNAGFNSVDFSYARFEKYANFSYAKFNGNAKFTRTEFNDSVYFSHTEFIGKCSFSHTIFSASQVSFNNAIFNKVFFLGTVFKCHAIFSDARFCKA